MPNVLVIGYGSVLQYRPDDGFVELKHVALYISIFNDKLMHLAE
jgi:hypothetical protein